MPFVPTRDGQALYVRVIGRGQPVLMLPGLGMSSRQWLPFVLPNTRSFRFYMPDFRGHGRSLNVRLNQTDVFQNNTDDVRDVIDHFKLEDFLLAGISLGATTAMHLQRETGLAGVRRYLHIDQSPNLLNGDDWSYGLAGDRQIAFFEQLRETALLLLKHPEYSYFYQLPRTARKRVSESVAKMMGLFGGASAVSLVFKHVLPLMPGLLVRSFPLMHIEDIAAYLLAYSSGGHDYRPTLSKGVAPVTLMMGMQSALYASTGQEWVADNAVSSSVVRFERSGHIPLIDEPGKFYREFTRFLRAE